MPNRTLVRNLGWPAAAGALALLIACSNTGSNTSFTGSGGPGTGGGGAGAPQGPAISGTVATPVSSAITQTGPRTALADLATPLGAAVNTTAPNTTPLGAGVTVNLIQIDGNGHQVGGVLATTTTDASGNYTLTAPYGFVPGPSYVAQAVLGTTTTLLSFVTGTTANINPYTQTTVGLVTGSLAGASPSTLRPADITAVQQTVLTGSGNITLPAGSSATAMASALTANVKNDVEANNIVTNLAAATGITGSVTGPDGNPVAGVQILVRTFGNQVTAAMTRTDASGTYTVHVAAGDYIIGAINDTATSTAASTWWASGGAQATSQFKATKVTVAASGNVTKNFTLQAGARLAGSITTSDSGQPLAGIVVTLVDFVSSQTLMNVTTLPDGTFTFNVAPGSYYVSARNSTLQPYATAVWLSGTPTGGANKCLASPAILVAGDSKSGAMTLEPGHQISGLVSDPTTGPVAGMVLRLQDGSATGAGAFAESMRTGQDGTYKIWVQPGIFNLFCRGQQKMQLDARQANQVQNFAAAVSQISTTLQDPSGNPVSQAQVYLYPRNNAIVASADPLAVVQYNQAQGWEISNSDGTVTLYAPAPIGNVEMAFNIDDGEMYGTSIYAGPGQPAVAPSLSRGNAAQITGLAVGTPIILPAITIPAGAVLSGNVADPTGAPRANAKVQIRIGNFTTGNYQLATTRTMSDGSYSLSLPANALLAGVVAFPASYNVGNNGSPQLTGSSPASLAGNYAYATNVQMGVAGSSKTLNFNF